jgi:hypothetical protein
MTAGKAIALALGLAGACALGVVMSPYVMERMDPATPMAVDTTPLPTTAPEATPPSAPTTTVARVPARKVTVVRASAPELQDRLKPVLNAGTNFKWASDGFQSAEQFATVAHAARNTGVPFAVLKDRVLKGKSLAGTIREFKPNLDAAAEVRRAQSMARADVSAISGN